MESLLGAMREAGPPPPYRGPDHGAQSLPDDLVDGFRLLEEIGHGGQGVVFRALQESTGREVALKLLRDGPLADLRSRHRFEREIELVASLTHPNLITIHGAGHTEDGRGWVCMELVEGCNLKEFLRQEDPGLEARLALLAQVAEGLIAAHRHGVIHLDLKPANVLLRPDGQVRIVDFGLARSLVGEARTLSLEDLGGTPGFMAPEQVRSGLAACDIRTDIHALGALLFFLLTGKTPYRQGDSAFSHLEAIATGGLRDLEQEIQASPHAPRGKARLMDLVAICRMTMATDPEHRYRRVEDLTADLQAFQTGGVVHAREGERRYRLRKRLQSLRPVLLLLLGATLVTSAAIWAAWKQRDLTDLADQRFLEAQEIAEAFLLEIDPLLAQLPGSGPAREQIIRRGTTYLEHLLTSAPEDPSLRLKAARGFHAIARVQADIYTMSSGRLEEAAVTLARFFEALPPEDALRTLSLEEQEFAFVLGVQSHLLGARLARDLGQLDRRRLELTAAMDAFKEGSPFQAFDTLRAHSMVLEEWGRWVEEQGELEQAKDHLQRSRGILEGMVTTFAGQPTAMRNLERDLAVLIFHESRLHQKTGDLDRAEALLLTFLATSEARLQDGAGLVAMRDVATAKDRMAGLAKAKEDFQEALVWTEEARDLHGQMVAMQPEHPNAWAGQLNLTNRMGELHLAAGQTEKARIWFALFLEECQAFTAGFPDFPRAKRMLGVAHYKQFELAKAEARRQDAADALATSLQVFRRMEAEGLLGGADAEVPAALEQELTDFKASW